MKKTSFLILIFISLFAIDGKSQTAPETPVIQTSQITDWNTLRRSGFYDCDVTKTPNAPNKNFNWFWGLNIGHSVNIDKSVSTIPYYYNAQILMGINSHAAGLPSMYIRSTNKEGLGLWAKVLHDQGTQIINGGLVVQDDFIIQTGVNNSTPLGEYGKKLYFGSGSNDNNDAIWISRYNLAADESELRINVGDDKSDRFVVGNSYHTDGKWRGFLTVQTSGVVTVGSQDLGGNLEVNGVIRAKEVKIEATNWPDYVFNKEYNLPTLKEVEEHIKEYNHLPNIPSETEVKEKGVDLGDMQAKLLQKIEELTLYMIEQDKENKEQRKLIEVQSEQIKHLQELVGSTK
ncbi:MULTISPECIES: hypothetical protein [unclassified Dysgonomonas]|uniref:hypothetical protein n=1 Tax=unclassified Dysgonomonas TaxID=2630389 RepID=UPI0013EB6E6F|nr:MULTISPECIES: hypothetical protein [unclassified Dysgonomonas]